MSTKTYEARLAGCRPGKLFYAPGATFSVGIGEVGTRAAAIYRVKGNVEDEDEVDRLAARLVDWLNDPVRIDRAPMLIPHSIDKSAKIMLTSSGRKNGWLK